MGEHELVGRSAHGTNSASEAPASVRKVVQKPVPTARRIMGGSVQAAETKSSRVQRSSWGHAGVSNSFGRDQTAPVGRIQRRVDGQLGLTGGSLDTEAEQRIQRSRGRGRALPPDLSTTMGRATGADFGGVRIHTDGQANQLSQRIQARAITTGSDVLFREGEYRPTWGGGQKLVAHELTHVVQRGGAAVQPIQGHRATMKPRVQRTLEGSLVDLTPTALSEQLKAKHIHLNLLEVRKLFNAANDSPKIFSSIDEVIKAFPTECKQQPTGQSLPPSALSATTLASQKPREAIKEVGEKAVPKPTLEPKEERKAANQSLSANQRVEIEAMRLSAVNAITLASEDAQKEAIEQAREKEVPKPELAPKEERRAGNHQPLKAGGSQLIINFVWLGNKALGPLEKFNLYSWRALGHAVNIYTHPFADKPQQTVESLGLEDGDATVVALQDILGSDGQEKKDTLGDARSILQNWLGKIPKGKTDKGADIMPTQDQIFNMVDLTKSYIGGTRRGIVLDMKVGPSVHLQDYAASFNDKLISYTRGGNTAGLPENQSIGTMQESGELRNLYAANFNKRVKKLANSDPFSPWFNHLTGYHGQSYQETKKWLDTATEYPPGKLRGDFSVSEPGGSGRGPFRVFKAASDQTNKNGLKTKPRDVQDLASHVVKKELSVGGIDDKFVKKARLAMELLPSQ